MRYYILLFHCVLEWSPQPIESWQVSDSLPSGFYCTRQFFANDAAVESLLAYVRSYYEDTTDWFVNNLPNLGMGIEQAKLAPFCKVHFKNDLGATFYPQREAAVFRPDTRLGVGQVSALPVNVLQTIAVADDEISDCVSLRSMKTKTAEGQ